MSPVLAHPSLSEIPDKIEGTVLEQQSFMSARILQTGLQVVHPKSWKQIGKGKPVKKSAVKTIQDMCGIIHETQLASLQNQEEYAEVCCILPVTVTHESQSI